MARQRTLKPEFWADDALAELTRDARLLYIGLWNLADEQGRARGDARYVKGQLFPYDDDLSAAAVDALLDDLAKAKKVQRYRSDGGSYLFLPNLGKHQRLEPDKTPSKLPAPPELGEHDNLKQSENFPDLSAQSPEELSLFYCSSSSLLSSSSGEIPGQRPATSAAAAPPPTKKKTPTRAGRIGEDWKPSPGLLEWARTELPTVDARMQIGPFVDYWLAQPGQRGVKNNWDATFRNWLRKSAEYAGRASPRAAASPGHQLFNPEDH
jgi:hypothetical protein